MVGWHLSQWFYEKTPLFREHLGTSLASLSTIQTSAPYATQGSAQAPGATQGSAQASPPTPGLVLFLLKSPSPILSCQALLS